MGMSSSVWASTRQRLQTVLSSDDPTLRDDAQLRSQAFVAQNSASMHLPAKIGSTF